MQRAGAPEVDKLVELALSNAMLGHKGSGRRCCTLPRTGMEERRREEGEKFRLKPSNETFNMKPH